MDRSAAGFALVVALLFLAFIGLLVGGMTTLLWVEIAANDSAIAEVRAKQQALYALAEAVGTVKTRLGPDRRVTARADILGDEVEHRLWTGVWRTDATKGPEWLVSAESNQPLDPLLALPLGRNQVRIAQVGEEVVRVPLVKDAANRSAHGWWVADEGVKATLHPHPNRSQEEAVMQRQVAKQVLPPLSALPGDDGSIEEEEALRSRVLSVRSLDLLSGTGVEQSFFADYTSRSIGVPTNTLEGGLRHNLAEEVDSDWIPAGLSEAFEQYLDAEHRIVPQGVSAVLAENIRSGQFVHAPRPVVTQAAVYLGGFRYPAPQQHRLKLHMTIRINLWNPYAAPMAGWPESEELGADLYLQLQGLPLLSLFWETAGGQVSGHHSVASAALDWKYSAEPSQVSVELQALPLAYQSLAPGEIRTLSIRLVADLGAVIEDATPQRYTDDYYNLAVPATQLNLRLSWPDDSLLASFDQVTFSSTETNRYQDRRLGAVGVGSQPAYSEYALVYHWALNADALFAENEERWQMPEIRAWEFDLAMIAEPSATKDALYAVGPDPALAAMDFSVFPGRPDFFYGGNGSLGRNYVCLFDFAASRSVSLSYAWHLYRYGMDAAIAEGGRDGGLQHLPDRLFYAATDVDSAYVRVREDTPDDAEGWMLYAAFNLNSTSVAAWEAILGARQYRDWHYRILHDPGLSHSRMNHFLTRFPHTAQLSHRLPFEQWDLYPQVSADAMEQWYRLEREPNWINAYAAGVRLLTDAQVHELATAIVAELRDRGTPFFSIGGLLDDGLLQRAIDQTSINVVGEEAYLAAATAQRMPRSAPSFLSQLDLLQHFADTGMVRSDTFVVRAYGTVYHPLTGEQTAQAWCEATLQRLPEMEPWGTEEGYRRFVVTGFRWLTEDEV